MPDFQKNPGEAAGYLRALGARFKFIDHRFGHSQHRGHVPAPPAAIPIRLLTLSKSTKSGEQVLAPQIPRSVSNSERNSRAAERVHSFRIPNRAVIGKSPGAIPGRHDLVQLRTSCFARANEAKDIDKAQADIGMPLSVQADFQGTAASFQSSWANEPILILAALVTVYIVLGVLYESYVHPITILSTLPSAGVGAILALMICAHDFSVIALIGIILLIGIVKKNGIMMIDFALEAERKRGQERRRRDLPSLPAAISSHHHDHHGRTPRRHAAGPGHRHRLGTPHAPGHRHGRRPAFQPDPHPLHHPGHLSSSSTTWPRDLRHAANRRMRQKYEAGSGGLAMSISVSIHSTGPSAPRLLTVGHRARRRRRIPPAGVAAPAGRFPHHFRRRQPARRQPRNHGLLGGHAARAPIRPHRRRHRNDLLQLSRHHQHHPAIRSQSRHRRRRTRCASRHQRRAKQSARPISRAIPPTARSIPPTRRS